MGSEGGPSFLTPPTACSPELLQADRLAGPPQRCAGAGQPHLHVHGFAHPHRRPRPNRAGRHRRGDVPWSVPALATEAGGRQQMAPTCGCLFDLLRKTAGRNMDRECNQCLTVVAFLLLVCRWLPASVVREQPTGRQRRHGCCRRSTRQYSNRPVRRLDPLTSACNAVVPLPQP